MKESNEDFILRSQKEFYELQELVSQTLLAAQVYNTTMTGRVGSVKSNLLVSLLECVNANVDKGY